MSPLPPGAALLPLRLFLGSTFVYAGIQKLSDPGFLHPGASTYIGTQLRGFASGTPGGFLLRTFALPSPKLAGVGVALTEILIGLLVLGGLLTRVAAGVGLGLNLILFLTNSWHTYPYFLGSDIVFVFAWLPFVLAGAAEQPAVDHVLGRWGARGGRPTGRSLGPALTRRAVLARALGVAGMGTLVIGGLSALLKGSYRGPSNTFASSRASKSKSGRAPAAATQHQPHPAGSLPQGATKLGPSNRLPAGQAATYPDPVDGQPDILIRDPSGELRAFSAVCTHAGCTVGYQQGEIVCPCHGGAYDARTGAVLSGPPPQGLARKRVVESGGNVYAVPS